MRKIFTFKAGLFFCAFVWSLAISGEVKAQDPQFSQTSFATPLFLNPAFAGSTSQWRATALYRSQWRGVGTTFNTALFSVDHNMQQHHNGVGFTFMNDRAGDYISNAISGYYAHHVPFNSFVLSLGLQASFYTKSLNPSSYIFRDQLRIDDNQLSPTNETFGNMTFNFPSFGGGAVVKNEKFWFGLSANHLNTPQKSLVNEVPLLPMKITVHGGLNLLGLNKHGEASGVSGYPGFVFRKQAGFTQLDIGANFSKDAMRGMGFIVGGWYRGMLIKSPIGEGNRRQDAISIIGGISAGSMSFVYSYDMTISRLSPYSRGSHEVSIIFENNRDKNDMRKGGIANPIYMEKFAKKKSKK